jgi:hypothetical protein
MIRPLRLSFALGLVLAPQALAQTEALNPLAYLMIRVQDEAPVPPRGASYDVEIDRTIHLDWDEPRFFAAVSPGLGAQGAPLAGRIAFLSDVLDGFVTAQTALLELRTVSTKLATARLRGENVAALGVERDTASNRFSAAASAPLKVIDGLATNPAYAGAEADAARLRAAVNTAILGDDYAPVGQVIRDELTTLGQELQQRASTGDSVLVYMTAWLHSGGTRRQLHLPGYDDFIGADPTPFPRIRFSTDDRTRRELESASALADRIENLDSLRAQVRKAGQAFRDALRGLADKAALTETNSSLGQLATDLRTRALGADLQASIERTRQDIDALLHFAPPAETGGNDAAVLIAFAGSLDAAIKSVRSTAQTTGDRLTSLERELRAQSGALRGIQLDQAFQRIHTAAQALTSDPAVQGLFEQLEELSRQLGVTEEVIAGVGKVGAIGRRAGPDASLDTGLDLLSAGERHPGDYVVVGIKVTRVGKNPGSSQTLAEARQLFRLRVLGFYLEPRGALLFVDPRGAQFANQDFEPVIGLSYVGHVGFKNSGFWNDVLNPGLGLTLTLLDFEDGRDFELGIGGSLTLVRDLLFFGYGRNLPVKADYYTIGVNPLAVGDLLRAAGGGPTSK